MGIPDIINIPGLVFKIGWDKLIALELDNTVALNETPATAVIAIVLETPAVNEAVTSGLLFIAFARPFQFELVFLWQRK